MGTFQIIQHVNQAVRKQGKADEVNIQYYTAVVVQHVNQYSVLSEQHWGTLRNSALSRMARKLGTHKRVRTVPHHIQKKNINNRRQVTYKDAIVGIKTSAQTEDVRNPRMPFAPPCTTAGEIAKAPLTQEPRFGSIALLSCNSTAPMKDGSIS